MSGPELISPVDDRDRVNITGQEETFFQCAVTSPNHYNILTLEENALHGGFGSAVLEMLSEYGLGAYRVKRIGLPDQFIEHGAAATLRHQYGLDVDGIVRTAMEMVTPDKPRQSMDALTKQH